MATREEFSQKWGPLQMEAVCRAMVDEINRLHKKLGMAEISYQRALDEVMNHLSDLEPYDWMKRRP